VTAEVLLYVMEITKGSRSQTLFPDTVLMAHAKLTPRGTAFPLITLGDALQKPT